MSATIPTMDELREVCAQSFCKTDVCKRYNINLGMLNRWLAKYGMLDVFPAGKRLLPVPTKQELIELHHTQKMSLEQLCEHYGRGWQYVRKWMKDLNVEQRLYKSRRRLVGVADHNLKQMLTDMHHADRKSIKDISIELEVSDVQVGNWFAQFGIEKLDVYVTRGTSRGEQSLIDFIDSISDFPSVRTSQVLANKKQIDCYLSHQKLGFEYHGLYWHSEANQPNRHNHLDKLKAAEVAGITLVQIFEDEWLDRGDIVRSMLQSRLGKTPHRMHARKLTVAQVDQKSARIFFEQNHLQGPPQSIELAIGLYQADNLVACMCFGKHHRKSENNTTIVLNRFATKLHTQIPGAASKLLNAAVPTLRWKYTTILSWSDRRWSVGNLYQQLGFVHKGTLPPDYYYTKGQKRWPKQRFQKRMTGCPANITESDWANTNGFYKIWDCGKDRWELLIAAK